MDGGPGYIKALDRNRSCYDQQGSLKQMEESNLICWAVEGEPYSI